MLIYPKVWGQDTGGVTGGVTEQQSGSGMRMEQRAGILLIT